MTMPLRDGFVGGSPTG